MARRASAAPSRPPATDTTENLPGAAAMTWAQEPPIDPVAPRIASRLGAVPRFGARRRAKVDEFGSAHHWNSPLAMKEPRVLTAATTAAKADAAMNESSRSISPPWPGMRRLESLTPKRRLTAEFEQVAQLRHHRGGEPERKDRADPERSGDEHEAERKAERRRPRARRRSRPTRSCPARRSATASVRRSRGRRNRRRRPRPRRWRTATGSPATRRSGSPAGGRG